MNEDNIVEFKPCQVSVKPERVDRCYHGWRCGYTADPEKRTVECNKCGALLDPIFTLIEIGRGQEYARKQKAQTA